MKLEYLHDLSELEEHEDMDLESEQLVRLYEFNQAQALQLYETISQTLLNEKRSLHLAELDFMECINCTVTLRIAEEDLGIHTTNNTIFYCDLTLAGYQKMVRLIEPFCGKKSYGYQWLYEDLDNPIDFLFSPRATW
jgi:hypothetical protein